MREFGVPPLSPSSPSSPSSSFSWPQSPLSTFYSPRSTPISLVSRSQAVSSVFSLGWVQLGFSFTAPAVWRSRFGQFKDAASKWRHGKDGWWDRTVSSLVWIYKADLDRVGSLASITVRVLLAGEERDVSQNGSFFTPLLLLLLALPLLQDMAVDSSEMAYKEHRPSRITEGQKMVRHLMRALPSMRMYKDR
jgi:hypothetical protein